MKFSGSISSLGFRKHNIISAINRSLNPTMSLNVKYGWKGLFSICLEIPRGLLDPVWCKNRICTMEAAAIAKGRMKWRAKNRVKVALFKAKPPQTHWTSSVPARGMADKRLVITVAPQNDICPQGST